MTTLLDELRVNAFDAIAKSRSVNATQDEIALLARRMATKGYVFTDSTCKLLAPYIESTKGAKGIAIAGPVGIGKTLFFRLAGVPNAINLKVAQGWELSEIGKAMDSFVAEPVLIDDVGAEDLAYKSFGTSVRLLDFILEHRIGAPAPTYLTTNLSLNEIEARYDLRVSDRVKELMRFLVIDSGDSLRGKGMPNKFGAWFEEFIKGSIWRECAYRCRFYDEMSHRCTRGIEHEPRNPEACPYL